MIANTAADLGSILAERRKGLSMTQADLAALIGTSRQWIVKIESGSPTAQVGLVLRALRALGLSVDLRSSDTAANAKSGAASDPWVGIFDDPAGE